MLNGLFHFSLLGQSRTERSLSVGVVRLNGKRRPEMAFGLGELAPHGQSFAQIRLGGDVSWVGFERRNKMSDRFVVFLLLGEEATQVIVGCPCSGVPGQR